MVFSIFYEKWKFFSKSESCYWQVRFELSYHFDIKMWKLALRTRKSPHFDMEELVLFVCVDIRMRKAIFRVSHIKSALEIPRSNATIYQSDDFLIYKCNRRCSLFPSLLLFASWERAHPKSHDWYALTMALNRRRCISLSTPNDME